MFFLLLNLSYNHIRLLSHREVKSMNHSLEFATMSLRNSKTFLYLMNIEYSSNKCKSIILTQYIQLECRVGHYTF